MKTRPPLNAPDDSLWVRVSLAKLLEHYDPFQHLGHTRRPAPYYLHKVKPQATPLGESERFRGYTGRRIAWFLQEGWNMPPSVDWVWDGFRPVRLTLTDGHHRFCAAILSGDTRLTVCYSGPIRSIPDLL